MEQDNIEQLKWQEMKKKSAVLDEKQAEKHYRERLERRMQELDNMER